MVEDSKQRKPVDGRPDWLVETDGHNKRYIHVPSGEDISYYAYRNLDRKYRGQDIPQSAIGASASASDTIDRLQAPTTKPPFMSGSTAPKQEYFKKAPPMPEHPDPSAQNLGRQQAQAQQQQNREPESRYDNVIEMVPGVKETPKGKRYDHRTKHPRASAQALGIGIKKLLLLITVLVVAKILNDDRAAMTEQEASLLGMALGNLLEPTGFNEQYGWLLAETGDYQAIGYVLIMYGGRINDIVQEKRKAAQQTSSPGMPPPSAPSSNSYQSTPQNNAPRTPGANLPFSPLKAPPGINPNYGG